VLESLNNADDDACVEVDMRFSGDAQGQTGRRVAGLYIYIMCLLCVCVCVCVSVCHVCITHPRTLQQAPGSES
jgi:hypothetical protein